MTEINSAATVTVRGFIKGCLVIAKCDQNETQIVS